MNTWHELVAGLSGYQQPGEPKKRPQASGGIKEPCLTRSPVGTLQSCAWTRLQHVKHGMAYQPASIHGRWKTAYPVSRQKNDHHGSGGQMSANKGKRQGKEDDRRLSHSQSRQLENPSRPQNGYRLSLDGAAQRACLDGYSLAYFLIDALDTARHHLPVPFNSGTGIGVPNILADSRHFAAFFASVTYAIGASMVSMVGRSGGVLARAGFQDAGTPTLLRACHPDWRRDGGFNTHLGGHHA
ncbi:hypothetical protein [Laribacter hongkongensis]|uniref:hypothetical protein n=2 Tax=Laribacter hongkongensis TaxID=168471 RepID=UPI0012DE819B|nr:hypothetical protein [Laribacter hongkongensis]